MRKCPVLRRTFVAALLISLVPSGAGAEAVKDSTTSGVSLDQSHYPVPDPWLERGITRHVDRQQYSGRLDHTQLRELRNLGKVLFTAKFTSADGNGRPMATQAILPTKRNHPPRQAFSRTAGMDANACSSCHNDPLTGGAGDFTANVFVSEGFNNTEFDNTDPQFSNERNTNHLFGAGLIELLAREMSSDLILLRNNALRLARSTNQQLKVNLITKDVSFGFLIVSEDGFVDTAGITGVDPDLVIKPFSQKGVMTSLRQFSINALNHHHGMQATERFGSRWTDEHDFDEDTIVDEISAGDISALVAWQAGLPPPARLETIDTAVTARIKIGEAVFGKAGCSECHRPALPLRSLLFSDPGPLDNAGTLRMADVKEVSIYDLALLQWAQRLDRSTDGAYNVPLFGDLKRHRISDHEVSTLGNELLAQRFVDRDVFITAELWGAGSTAPYGHRGDLTTLDEIIRAHGGEARKSRDQYLQLDNRRRGALISFLQSMVIIP